MNNNLKLVVTLNHGWSRYQFWVEYVVMFLQNEWIYVLVKG